MRRAYVLAGVLVLSAVMFASIGAAVAQTVHFADLEINLRGVIWQFSTQEAIEPFSGKDVIKSSVVANTWDEDGNDFIIEPIAIITTQNRVILVFLPTALPDHETVGSQVTGFLKNEDEFIASGPGFGFGVR